MSSFETEGLTSSDDNELNICDSCHQRNVPDSNLCDFCYSSWCDACIPNNIFFHKCETCGIQWCMYLDGYCSSNEIKKGYCTKCGN